MEFAKNVQQNKAYCYDCKKKIEIKNNEVQNGVLLGYNDNGEKLMVFKCNQCFAKDPSLSKFRKCEVYSRIVGYLRPIKQWNKGKKREFEERKNYEQKEA
jgi:anaerobic ribonucleoside-triphosphate reductase